MKFREFLSMYDNWNGIICVNDDGLNRIIKGDPFVVLSHGNLSEMYVVSFGFYDNELCVRVR